VFLFLLVKLSTQVGIFSCARISFSAASFSIVLINFLAFASGTGPKTSRAKCRTTLESMVESAEELVPDVEGQD
jgi:hypothetical protein